MGELGEVGNTKLFDNDKLILWEFVLEPGECTPLHTHQHDYVWYALEGATLEVLDENQEQTLEVLDENQEHLGEVAPQI